MTCCVCGKKFVIKEYDKNRGHGQYCSKSCRSKVIGFSQLKGKPKTYEHRKKLSLSHSGENNYRWMGGKKKENITIRKGFEHRAWSKETLRFDNYTCVRCGKRGGALHAHHIVRFSEDVLSRFDQDNGITLCEECHHFVHSGEFLSRPEKYANSCSVRGDYAAVY